VGSLIAVPVTKGIEFIIEAVREGRRASRAASVAPAPDAGAG
jgi:hypothetical protein